MVEGPDEEAIEQTIQLAALIGDVMDRATAIAIIELSEPWTPSMPQVRSHPRRSPQWSTGSISGQVVPSGGTGTRRNPRRPELLEGDAYSGGQGTFIRTYRALFVPLSCPLADPSGCRNK